MNNTIPVLQVSNNNLPKPDFQDSRNNAPAVNPATARMLRTAPPNYAVLRQGSSSGSISIEKFTAENDEEALERLKREVRQGESAIICCYKLWTVERYVASSESLTPEDFFKEIETYNTQQTKIRVVDQTDDNT